MFALVFALMSGGAMYCILGLMLRAPALAEMREICPEMYYPINETKRVSEVRKAYTGIEALDRLLCQLVFFFLASLEPDQYPTTLVLLTAFPSVAIFPFVESARRKASGSFIPSIGAMVVGSVFQVFGGGVILPLYWILILFSGRIENKTNKQIAPRQALAVLVGLVIGYYVPTYMMFSTVNIKWVAFWQAFPLHVMLIQLTTLALTPNLRQPSGARVIQVLYTLTFVIGAGFHLSVLRQIKESETFTLSSVFLPSVRPIVSISLAPVTKNLLQWDYIYIFGSAATLTLTLANSVWGAITLLLVHLLLSAALGAGAAFSAIMIWREEKMLRQSTQVVKTE